MLRDAVSGSPISLARSTNARLMTSAIRCFVSAGFAPIFGGRSSRACSTFDQGDAAGTRVMGITRAAIRPMNRLAFLRSIASEVFRLMNRRQLISAPTSRRGRQCRTHSPPAAIAKGS